MMRSIAIAGWGLAVLLALTPSAAYVLVSFTPDPDIDPTLPEAIQKSHQSTGAVLAADSSSNIATGSTVYLGLGLWLTNNHVVRPLNGSAIIRASDERVFDGSVVCTAPAGDGDQDLALISTEDPQLPPVALAKQQPSEGDPVWSNGNPLGSQEIIRSGKVERIGMDVNGTYSEYFIVTGPNFSSPGNSGGGMFNKQGELVGINTFGSPQDSVAIGLPSVLNFLETIAEGQICQGSNINYSRVSEAANRFR